MSEEARGEAIDPDGQFVSIDQQAARHILAEHPEMASHIGEIRDVIESPDAIKPDPWQGRRRYYRRDRGPSIWLFVVVDFDTEPARVITAYGRRKGPSAH